MTNIPSWWDPYSCQPYKLPQNQKPRVCAASLLEYSKVAATALMLSPALAWKYYSLKHQPSSPMGEFAGIGINAELRWQNAHLELVEEIGVRHLLLRVPVWQLDQLDSIAIFMEKFPRHEFVVNILQCRDSIINTDEWQIQVNEIVGTLSPQCRTFKIGTAVNRTKWGCRHSGDAIKMFKTADEIRSRYPGIRILGSSVIDFEPLITLRTLFNFADYQYDGCAALLYINRRGSAYGKQYGYFDLERKLRLIRSILDISNNTGKELWITETNWPLLNTRPYTPNSGHPRSTVDETTQAEHLTQYFSVANNTGWVKRVYWWQLINPGYGLVDHRQNQLRKMPSFHAFKQLLEDSTPQN